ncbi:MAG: hypothetical protein KIT18_06335, partial [Burkholderiales bacterium]|nr:hypothetical protein [Burkholderiales bacterium]
MNRYPSIKFDLAWIFRQHLIKQEEKQPQRPDTLVSTKERGIHAAGFEETAAKAGRAHSCAEPRVRVGAGLSFSPIALQAISNLLFFYVQAPACQRHVRSIGLRSPLGRAIFRFGQKPLFQRLVGGGVRMKSTLATLTMTRNLRFAIAVFLLLAASQAIAAETTACNLLDKATASEIFGRAAARGPTPFTSQNQGRALSNCDFAVDQPLIVLSLRIAEHESPAS